MNYQSRIVSREPPEKELSTSPELYSTNSDLRTSPVPSSSNLSEGWCSSVLGRPCAKVRIYPQGFNPLDRRELEQGIEDNIGNLFGKKEDNDRRQSTASRRETPRAQNSVIRELETQQQQQPFETEILPERDVLKDTQSRDSEQALVNNNPSPENSQEVLPNQVSNSITENLTVESLEEVATDSKQEKNITETDALQDPELDKDRTRYPEKTASSAKERDKGSVYSNSEKIQIEKNKLRRLICYCDENSQTPPPSILKTKPVSKSDPIFPNERYRKTWTAGRMDGYPEREFSRRASRDSQKIVLTSDKVQQTSDDLFFSSGKNTASNTDQMETIDTSINTFNTESVKVQTSERSSSSPEEERNFWPGGRMTAGRHLCGCSPPRLSELRRQGSFSSPSVSPRTVDSYRSERSSTAPRKKPAVKQFDIRRPPPEERRYSFCVPPYQECPIYPCRQALGRQTFKPPRRETRPNPPPKQKPIIPIQRRTVAPCDGSCRCFPRKPETPPRIGYHQPAPCRPPHPYSGGRFESSSSDEQVDNDYDEDDDGENEGDTDGYTSEGSSSRKHSDLPYQNNDEYLELVQELQETLQSRNRNRVNRAMKEFEHKSKYNRPLERPILNYGEPSESEEPIMRKISELTEKRRNCKGDCCGCRKDETRDRQAARPPRVKPPQATKPWNNSKPPPKEIARWQMDKISGEWFKICQNLPKLPPPSIKKEHVCGCSCSCGK